MVVVRTFQGHSWSAITSYRWVRAALTIKAIGSIYVRIVTTRRIIVSVRNIRKIGKAVLTSRK